MSDKIVFVSFSKIIYCEASGPYTYVYLTDGKSGFVKSLGEFEAQLSGIIFSESINIIY
jgi:DNA-binding LytR/AlgR family response regulator